MKYFEFFDLKKDPFSSSPDPDFFFPSKGHAEAIESIKYFLNSDESIMLVVGDAGAGKTTVIKTFIRNAPDNTLPLVLYNSTIEVEEFIFLVLGEITKSEIIISDNLKRVISKAEVSLIIEKELERLNWEGKRFVILIDECQDLSQNSLTQIKHLSNLEKDGKKYAKFILFGLPFFERTLKSEENIQLNQRISLRVYLGALNFEEVENYINFRLSKAGGNRIRFEKSAVKAIYKASKGIPRLVNLISSRALMVCQLEKSYVVEKFHVKVSLKHLRLD